MGARILIMNRPLVFREAVYTPPNPLSPERESQVAWSAARQIQEAMASPLFLNPVDTHP